jgi:hypothetical protein
MFRACVENNLLRIQDGDYGTEAGSMSSVNQKPCWDIGATLGRNKVPRRIKTSTSWTPNLWKTSPCHVTLRKQVGCCHCHPPAPNLLGRHLADQTGSPKGHVLFPQPCPLGRLTSHCKKQNKTKQNWTINSELKTSTQKREWDIWKCTGEKAGGVRR